MLEACRGVLPVDVAVCVAAVADWRPAGAATEKLKKGQGTPNLELVENPDILATLAVHGPHRPKLVIGFAAETSDVAANAAAKRRDKGCDWIVANDVSAGSGTFGGERNTVTLVTAEGSEPWPEMTKIGVAERLATHIACHFGAAG
jgi:phosphopantothenoylcysteine decarboxylase/phosphopantothenate--cysteine ligase